MAEFPQYLSSDDMFYPSILSTITKRKGNPLQPVFEAFTNAIEALEDKSKGKIEVCVYLKKDLFPEDSDLANFDKISIQDNGIGFNNTQFDRLKMLRDTRKGPSNRGTGRIQFIHYFSETIITSIYKDDLSATGFKKRVITLSKSKKFIDRNSIMRIDNEEEIPPRESSTTITFIRPIDEADGNYYAKLDANLLKEEITHHYLALFCEIQKNFPKIKIRILTDNKKKSSESIVSSEIPSPDKILLIKINYSRIENNKIVDSDKKEGFELKAFRISSEKLDKNEIKLVSKGEIAMGLYFDGLLPKEEINGERFLFLLSGKYIDEKDTDTRGQINLLESKNFLNQYESYLTSCDDNKFNWISQHDEEILLSNIENVTNNKILNLYPEIESLRNEKNKKIDELKDMFLLSPNAILNSRITINDSYEDILTKVYREEARLMAQKDAKFREHFRKIKSLKPDKTTDYQKDLDSAVVEFVKDIPFKDKILLAKYVARRRLVIEIFEDLLNNDERKMELGGRIDEKILHNLMFQQSSNNPEDSDLWLINEEFIYFKGTSESYLYDLQYDGRKIMKDEKSLTQEQIRYLNSLNEKRLEKKPDVLLFPNEGKCIIIEFKAPDVNVSRYIGQIDYYAALLRNFSIDEMHINSFYGYLIGESIEDVDVRGINHRMEHSHHFEYWFRPGEPVPGFYGRTDGSIYLEVIKYSTLLKRAKIRNRMFMEKLGISIDYDKPTR
jgi:hypothetical protein